MEAGGPRVFNLKFHISSRPTKPRVFTVQRTSGPTKHAQTLQPRVFTSNVRPGPQNRGFARSNVSPGWVGSAPPDRPGTHGPTRPLSSASPDRNYIISRLSDCRSSVYEGNWRNISCDRTCDRSCDSNMRSDPLTRKPLCDQASLESVHLNAQEHTSY